MTNTQPKALYFLFLTELWERFGFYIVQGLLILYMINHFNFSDSQSYTILGSFTALAYIAPVVGGYFANKFLGYTRSIGYGGFFLFFGYFLLLLPWGSELIYYALGSIIVGSGLLKPNISSLLGTQYEENDVRRDAGFTLFYVGINLGAFLAGVSSGYIREKFGWHVSFSLACVGLVIGMITFFMGEKYYRLEKKYSLSFQSKIKFLFCCFLTVIGFNFLLKLADVTGWLLPAFGLFLIFYLIFITFQQEPEYRKNLALLNLLILSSIVYWMLYWQMFYSVNLFVDRLVQKEFMGIPLTSTVFWGSEAIFIIILGPLFAKLWHSLSNAGLNPSPFMKFSLGIIFAGIGFYLLAKSTLFVNEMNLIPAPWVFIAYLMITIGELLLSPIGLSTVTVLAPSNLVSFMMGIWFVATGFGGVFAGVIAKIASLPNENIPLSEKLLIYQNAFYDYSHIAFAVGILFLVMYLGASRFIQKEKLD